jgi:hypothetical protein
MELKNDSSGCCVVAIHYERQKGYCNVRPLMLPV